MEREITQIRIDTDWFKTAWARLLKENKLPEAYLACTEAFQILAEQLLTVNQSMNLTALRDPESVIWKHFIDSLTIASYIPQNAVVLDIGTGAGFPALPLAIVRGDIRITAVDSTAKKIRYVESCIDLLGLKNVRAVSARVEESATCKNPVFREKFDIVVSRACARMALLDELGLPCVKVGGSLIAMKAENAQTELDEARQGITVLGGAVEDVIPCKIKNGESEETRNLILIRKIEPTDARYPRRFGKMEEKPL